MADFSTRADDLIIQTPNVFSALPVATMFPGARAYITDGASAALGTTAAGGGSNKILVASNGASWIVAENLSGGAFSFVTLNVGTLNATTITTDTLNATTINATTLNATTINATTLNLSGAITTLNVGTLNATTANITSLLATTATVASLSVTTATVASLAVTTTTSPALTWTAATGATLVLSGALLASSGAFTALLVQQVASIGSTLLAVQGAFPSGGNTAFGIKLSTASNFGIFIGTGVPSLSAATNSLYMRSDGNTATTRLYVALTAAGSWTAIMASA